jgi:hypothetical protein
MLSIKFAALALWIALVVLFFELDPRLHWLAVGALLAAAGFGINRILRHRGWSAFGSAGASFRSQGLWNHIAAAIQQGMKVLAGSSWPTLVAAWSIPAGVALFFFYTPNEAWRAARQALYDIAFSPLLTGTFQVRHPSPDELVVAPPSGWIALILVVVLARFAVSSG